MAFAKAMKASSTLASVTAAQIKNFILGPILGKAVSPKRFGSFPLIGDYLESRWYVNLQVLRLKKHKYSFIHSLNTITNVH